MEDEIKELLTVIGKVKTLVDEGYFTNDEAKKLTRYPIRALNRRRYNKKKYGEKIPKITFSGVFGNQNARNINK